MCVKYRTGTFMNVIVINKINNPICIVQTVSDDKANNYRHDIQ